MHCFDLESIALNIYSWFEPWDLIVKTVLVAVYGRNASQFEAKRRAKTNYKHCTSSGSSRCIDLECPGKRKKAQVRKQSDFIQVILMLCFCSFTNCLTEKENRRHVEFQG